MMASPNDYMDIIFPCLTTYLMLVPKMFFIVQQKKAISRKAFSRKAFSRKAFSKKAYSKKAT